MANSAGRAAVALGVVAAVFLSGCGQGKAPVTGKVTLDTRPVRAGQLTFVGPDGTKHVTVIGFDGRYTIEVPPGEYKVAVEPPGKSQMAKMVGMPKVGPPKAPKELSPMKDPTGQLSGEGVDLAKESQNPVVIPMRYRAPDSSGLKFTVTGSDDKFDIPMTGKG
jgi:hypothetical protein